jgi:hypothetical protein
MKQLNIALISLAIFTLSINNVYAGGDKVRGAEGDGSVVQNCLNFEGECPYGDYDPTDFEVTIWDSNSDSVDGLITWGAENPLFIDMVIRSNEWTNILHPLSLTGEISKTIVKGVDFDNEYDRSIFTEIDEDGHLSLVIYQKI